MARESPTTLGTVLRIPVSRAPATRAQVAKCDELEAADAVAVALGLRDQVLAIQRQATAGALVAVFGKAGDVVEPDRRLVTCADHPRERLRVGVPAVAAEVEV
jgi:hypothetical protein